MLHGRSVQHSHFDLTMWYIACFCLKSQSPDNLQPWCLASLCTTSLLTLLLLPFGFSCTPVCHPPTGPNCGSRPHCNLPVWNQRKPSACCLLAEGGESGKSKKSHTVWCLKNCSIFLIAFHIISYMWKNATLLVESFHYLLCIIVINTFFGFSWL